MTIRRAKGALLAVCTTLLIAAFAHFHKRPSVTPVANSVSAQFEHTRLPDLLPGTTCAQALNVLGRPEEDGDYTMFWKKRGFEVTVGKNSACVLTGIEFRVVDGYSVVTNDGVALGKSTLAEADRILSSRNGAKSTESPEGNWAATITLSPSSKFLFKTTYRAVFAPGVAEKMGRDPEFDDFRNIDVTEYSLEIAAPDTPPRP